MSRPAGIALCALVASALLGSNVPARCDESGANAPVRTKDGLEALVPELAAHPYRLDPGVRPYEHRLAFSPGFGALGANKLYSFRVAYNPNAWLGYEASIDHNPGQSTHAVLNMLSVILRRPLSGRFQPYVSAGYGMVMVSPGPSINADPVTKNTLALGGGLEVYIRGDLALRGEVRQATVFGRQGIHDDLVAFNYLEQTIGLSFYRTVRP